MEQKRQSRGKVGSIEQKCVKKKGQGEQIDEEQHRLKNWSYTWPHFPLKYVLIVINMLQTYIAWTSTHGSLVDENVRYDRRTKRGSYGAATCVKYV